MRFGLIFVILCAVAAGAQTQPAFSPIDHWKAAVISGDAMALKSFYRSSPAPQINTTSGRVDTDSTIDFWTGLKAKALTYKVLESGSPRPDVQLFTLLVKVTSNGGHVTNVVEGQSWQNQSGSWRIVGEKRDLAKLEQPATVNAHIYPTGNAREQISEAVARAGREHKNVLLVFGADWCYDCHVLEAQMKTPELSSLISKNFVVVEIDVGKFDRNLDLAEKYRVPLKKGIPALAVLDSNGKLLYAQAEGQFESARWLKYEQIRDFFEKWKPKR